ncbi:MAG: prepilin peptidase [Chloroflexi bacterium]|nr:prepilin peptidase [Chloroflexota bacterium]
MEIFFVAIIGASVGALLARISAALYARYALAFTPSPRRAQIIAAVSAIAFAVLEISLGLNARFFFAAIYTAVFLLVAITDLEHRYIFNLVIIPATIFAALASPFSQFGVVRAILGGAIAYALVFFIYILAPIYARVRHREIDAPFGFGDVKLAGFMGIVVGFPAVLNAIIFAILLGGAGAILFLAIQFARTRKLALDAAIPYGPFFCIAGWWLMANG